MEAQFTVRRGEKFGAVALHLKAVAGSAQGAHLGRFRVRFARVGNAPAVGSADRDRVDEIRAGRVQRPNQIHRRIQNRIGDVLKDVDAEDLTQTRHGPVDVEQGRTVQFHVDALLRSF